MEIMLCHSDNQRAFLQSSEVDLQTLNNHKPSAKQSIQTLDHLDAVLTRPAASREKPHRRTGHQH
jgi:hypothetical protein